MSLKLQLWLTTKREEVIVFQIRNCLQQNDTFYKHIEG